MVSRVIPCDRNRLRRLLDDSLGEPERSDLIDHLETCDSCRDVLESDAATGPWWAELRGLGPGIFGEGASPDRAPETIPDFLGPPQGPGQIGTFGPYRVLEVVGRGGMGVVLKAFDPGLHRYAAIKVLAPQLAVSPAARRRFTREARAAASISHDNVVSIYAVDESGGFPYLVMPYISGRSLQDRINREGPLRPEEVARVGMQVASGLAAAHAQGLIHRDIKPSNILMENGLERVRITDFGLARTADDASLTQSGVIAGTPQYMSPEQARGEAIDHRGDLFSLGSVIYAMCAGHSPFRAETAMGVLRRVSEDEPRPLREVDPGVPAWLESIAMKLLAKDPGARFQSAAEVAGLFERCLAHLREPKRCPLPDLPDAPRSGRQRRWPTGAGVALALAAFVVLFGIVIRLRSAEGTLIVEVEDPKAEVRVDGDELILTGLGLHEIRLKAGDHQVRATREGKAFLNRVVTIERDGKPLVVVRREPPEAGHDLRVNLPPPVLAPAQPPPTLPAPPTNPFTLFQLSSGMQPPPTLPAPPPPIASDPDVAPGDPESHVERARRERISEMRTLAESLELSVFMDHVVSDADAKPYPIGGRWSYPSMDVADGSLWFWGREGRPLAAVGLNLHPSGPKGPSWGHEFTSLMTKGPEIGVEGFPFDLGVDQIESRRTGQRKKMLWRPEGPGIKFLNVSNVPNVAGPPADRLAQLKTIATRFSLGQINGRTSGVRIGPDPVHRYQDEDVGVFDGAVFLVAEGGNPEALLLVEAQGPNLELATYRYALAPMTQAAISIKLDGEVVWERPSTSRPPMEAPYFIANRPRKTGGPVGR